MTFRPVLPKARKQSHNKKKGSRVHWDRFGAQALLLYATDGCSGLRRVSYFHFKALTAGHCFIQAGRRIQLD